jgi:hypothetical protein
MSWTNSSIDRWLVGVHRCRRLWLELGLRGVRARKTEGLEVRESRREVCRGMGVYARVEGFRVDFVGGREV